MQAISEPPQNVYVQTIWGQLESHKITGGPGTTGTNASTQLPKDRHKALRQFQFFEAPVKGGVDLSSMNLSMWQIINKLKSFKRLFITALIPYSCIDRVLKALFSARR